ncbi:Uncharacterised protein [Bordetella pertussis]|nr:Uncharacterised protein [Bordetella pertussis]CFO08378.1 Uncharacterised protein [Bordetella pertussis]CFO74038.1 Uncharacterised protein [Bordetella pertussis]CFU83102.1 Uncharacterised protein [Bordetella pertussis]CFW36798.1 Uncharacterised protein [Bordetella pertussis]
MTGAGWLHASIVLILLMRYALEMSWFSPAPLQ